MQDLEMLFDGSVIERIFTVRAAWDKRDPDPRKNYGIHGAELVFTVKRKNVAVTWVLMTGWLLAQNRRELGARGVPPREFDGLGSVDYHSPVALYPDQTPIKDCEHTGGDCYPDGSALASTDLFNKMLEKGEEAIWQELTGWLLNTERRIAEQRAEDRNNG